MDVWEIWRRLGDITELQFEAQPHSSTNSGWSGMGQGAVVVERTGPLTLIFHERGTWMSTGGKPMAFTNVFRWTVASE